MRDDIKSKIDVLADAFFEKFPFVSIEARDVMYDVPLALDGKKILKYDMVYTVRGHINCFSCKILVLFFAESGNSISQFIKNRFMCKKHGDKVYSFKNGFANFNPVFFWTFTITIKLIDNISDNIYSLLKDLKVYAKNAPAKGPVRFFVVGTQKSAYSRILEEVGYEVMTLS